MSNKIKQQAVGDLQLQKQDTETIQNKSGFVPFWVWNGKQSEKEISRQIKLAQAGGVRGLAVHARKGNEIEYMSERWLELYRHACLEAKKSGLEIWIYDEDGCPSGTVGERLPTLAPKHQQQALTFAYTTAGKVCSNGGRYGFRSEDSDSVWEFSAGKGELVRAFLADNLSCRVNPAELPDDTRVLAFSKVFVTDYINALSRDALEEFLKMTHQVYADKLGEFFGDPITAIYTDDLNHLLIYGENIPFLAYTGLLEDTFKNNYGYSLLDNLPALVENIPGCEKIRIDYRHTVMRMFLDNYVGPMQQWCKEHNLPLTGHLSGDEGSMLQSVCRFAAAMPFYEYEDIPGIDDFLGCRQDKAYMRHPFNELGFSAIILCKQASSVASQLKNGLCSSEVLTSRGWGVPVHLQTAQIQFQQGLGINIMVPHCFGSFTGGIAKRDHPASYFFQQPWFGENRKIRASLNTSSCLLSRGLCAAKVAVLNPVTSGWVALDGERLTGNFVCQYPSKYSDTGYLEQKFAEISLSLLQMHIDFEYVDEEILARHFKSEGEGLTIGNKSYDILLLPPMINIQQSTLDILAAVKCKVYQLGKRFKIVNGEPKAALSGFSEVELSELHNIKSLVPRLDFQASKEVLLHTREVEGQLEYFMSNFSEKKQTIRVNSKMENYVLYDPQNNLKIKTRGGFPSSFDLYPSACCHIISEEVVPDAAETDIMDTIFAVDLVQSLNTVMELGEVIITPENDNNLLLDSGCLADGREILFRDSDGISVGTEIIVRLNIPDPTRVFGVFAEKNELENMAVNNTKLVIRSDKKHSATQDLYWGALDGLLRSGENEIKITTDGKRIEVFYLSGRFAVELPAGKMAKITPGSGEALRLGDLSKQGLPFFWGKVKYELEFTIDVPGDGYWLDLGKVEGVVKVRVNGKNAGLGHQAPWMFNFDDLLISGNNHIEIELFNTAQNLFGPHRSINLIGPGRSDEGSSVAAWVPPLSGSSENSWGVAPFGIHGPLKLYKLCRGTVHKNRSIICSHPRVERPLS